MRLFTRFDRYLARLILVPLLACLTIAAMLLLLDKMLKLFDFVMNEGGPVSVVWRMLGNLIPEYLSLGIPIGVLLGILLAFRGLALSSELDALRAVGVSYNRMLRVPLVFAIVFAGVSFAIVGFFEPYSRYAYEGLQFELRSGALGASIKVGEFAKLAKATTIRVEESRAHGADLRGLFVRTEGKNGQSVAVTAERGTFLSTDDRDVILLRLTNGTMVHTASSFMVHARPDVQTAGPAGQPAVDRQLPRARRRGRRADAPRARPGAPATRPRRAFFTSRTSRRCGGGSRSSR